MKIQASERVLVGYTQVVSVGGTWDLLPEVLGLYRKEGGLTERGRESRNDSNCLERKGPLSRK